MVPNPSLEVMPWLSRNKRFRMLHPGRDPNGYAGQRTISNAFRPSRRFGEDAMPAAWLTYAWDDNIDGDVDFVAQELGRPGVDVKLDRWNIGAGKRLWDQIAKFIQDPAESDAWILYASQNSLGSEPCREEFAYALDRALETRGGAFPIIGLFNGPVDASLIPPAVKVRLCVSTTDPEWKERIVAAAEGRAPEIARPTIQPYQIRVHGQSNGTYAIEVRPRAGSWSPFCAAVPADERDRVRPRIMHGPAGSPSSGGILFNAGEDSSSDGKWWIMFAQNEATPTQSYYVFVHEFPSRLVFGVHNGQPQFIVERPGP